MDEKDNLFKIQAGFLLFSLFLITLLLFGQRLQKGREEEGQEAKTELEEEIHLMIATDLHYLSPELTDHGHYFTAMIESADGKTMEYCEEVVDVFAITAMQKKPDAVILTGDLTFNGAKKSHEDLAEKLKTIEEAGIPVLVIPGNHDLNSRNAAKFVGDGYERVEGITEEEFAKLYGAFGFDEAYARDKASGSYIWECSPALRLLFLDVNGVEVYNSVPDETLQWMEAELIKAEEEGVSVIAFSHQNLLRHSMFTDGYIIKNAAKVLQLYKKYGVIANFSGHLHIQHIEQQDGFTEVATSSLQVSPTQYADITWDGIRLTYQTASVDVAGWAKKQNLASNYLKTFDEYAKQFFYKTAYWKAYETLFYSLKDETLFEPLVRYYTEQNYAYFSGRLDLIEQEEDLLEEWRKLGTWTSVYLESISIEERTNQNYIVIE